MKEVEKMMSVGEILQSKKFQDEAPPQLKFIVRRVQRNAHRQPGQPIQKANQPKKVA